MRQQKTQKKTVFILFAPKFCEFGVDVVKQLIKKDSQVQIGALCNGGKEVVDYVKNAIEPKRLLDVWDLEYEETKWFDNKQSTDSHSYVKVDELLGLNAMSDIITSDRRIGAGFVRGGLVRPDPLKKHALNDKLTVPPRFVTNLVSFMQDLIEEHQPGCVFCYAVAGSIAVTLGKLCDTYQVPFLCLTPTRIKNHYIVDDSFKGDMVPVRETFENGNIDDAFIKEAQNYIEEYRTKSVEPEYMKFNKKELKKNKLIKLGLKFFLHNVLFPIRSILPKNIKYKLTKKKYKHSFFNLVIEFKKFVFIKYQFDDLPSSNNDFIFYPLHVDPEASTMVLSPMHTDQISVIEALAKSLPADTCLVVKEHLPMLGKRPRSFYKAIKQMPRVHLVSPYHDSKKLINQSKAVAVITGTAALEAMLLQKKPLIIGNSPCFIMRQGYKYESSLANLPNAISELDSINSVTEDTLIRFVASILACSFEIEASLLWGEYHNHAYDRRLDVCDKIAGKIYGKINTK